MIKIASRIATSPEFQGSIAVPQGQIISCLQDYLNQKYVIDMAYRSFADRVRGPWRDALVDHWKDHAKDERNMAYDLAMKVIGYGSDPIQISVTIPTCNSNVFGFIENLKKLELKAIKTGRELISMAGDDIGLKVLAENHVVLDTHHLDDLKRMSLDICKS